MATRATFLADFTSFERAVRSSETAMKSFQSGAAQVEKALSRVGDSFSGRRILQEATLAVKAVEDLGGVSKLTVAEQARLNGVVAEALAKYRALGMEAPANMVAIEKATRQVDQATGGISTKMIAIGTAIGTFLGTLAVDAVKALGREVLDLATNGIKLAPIVGSFERLTASIGQSGDAMLAVTRTATKGLVKDLDIMQAANKAILLGLPVTAEEFGNLASAATALGKAMGQDATKSLDDLITALGRSSPMILDNLGLTVKVGEANEQYARQVGKSAASLTDAEKKLAFYSAAVDAAKRKMEDLGGVQLTLADQLARLRNGFQNFTDALGVAIARSPVLNEVLGAIASAMEEAFGPNQTQFVQRLIGIVNDASIAFVDFGIVAVDVARGINAAYLAMAEAVELNVSNLMKGLLRNQLVTIDALIAAAAVLQRFDPTGIADRNLRTLLELRAIIGSSVTANNAFGRSLDTASEKLSALRGRLVELSKVQVSSAAIASDLVNRTGELAESNAEAEKSAKQLAEAYRQLMSETRNAQSMAIFEADAKFFNASVSDATTKLRELMFAAMPMGRVNTFGMMAEELRRLETTIIPGFQLVGPAIAEAIVPPPSALAAAFGRVRRSIATQLGPTILQALTGGGDIARSVGGLLGGQFTENLFGKGAQEALKTRLGKLFGTGAGSLIGSAIGSIVPGIGTLLGSLAGPLIGKIGGFFKGLFGGPSQDELEGRATAKQFSDAVRSMLNDTQKLEARMVAAGGASREWAERVIGIRDAYLATGRTAEQALQDTNRLWQAEKHGAEAVQRVIGQINEAFEEQRLDTERLNAAIEKYGFSLEQLGPAFRNQRLAEQAKELIEDWRVLVNSGIDLQLVNDKMAESINAFLQTALRTGAELPSVFRPILQSMVDQGVLVDANGEKITDLAAAGVTFSETMAQGFDRVVRKLQQLIDTLQGAGHAIEDLPDSVTVDVELRLRSQAIDDYIATLPNVFGIADRRRDYLLNNPDAPIPMAAGGAGVVTRPTLFLAGEAGREEFAFSGAGRRLDGGSDPRVLETLDRIDRKMGDLPADIQRAFRHALVLGGVA